MDARLLEQWAEIEREASLALCRNTGVIVPTVEEFLDQCHYNYTLQALRNDWHNWRCPACGRSPFQIMRRGRDGRWRQTLHYHHDHGFVAESAKSFAFDAACWAVSEGRKALWRFEPEHICWQCNLADAAVKRIHKLPKDFSFAPAEIALFISAHPHDAHSINTSDADQLYLKIVNGACEKHNRSLYRRPDGSLWCGQCSIDDGVGWDS